MHEDQESVDYTIHLTLHATRFMESIPKLRPAECKYCQDIAQSLIMGFEQTCSIACILCKAGIPVEAAKKERAFYHKSDGREHFCYATSIRLQHALCFAKYPEEVILPS